MTYQITSYIAFEEVLCSLGDRQKLVLSVYKSLNKPLNNLQVSKFLNLPINSITPRVLEIRSKGLITYHHTGACPITGRATKFYIIKEWVKGMLQ